MKQFSLALIAAFILTACTDGADEPTKGADDGVMSAPEPIHILVPEEIRTVYILDTSVWSVKNWVKIY